MTGAEAGRVEGVVFDVDAFAVHDGAGIRLAVYLKGCPMRCAWCHSPESQAPGPELILLGDRCAGCGACVEACRQDVHVLNRRVHLLDRRRCVACGACVEACPRDALALAGERISAAQIVARAVRMLPFFRHSGGGLTLTGGEPTAQPAFATAILAGCRDEGIHTAVETAGACEWETLRRLADLADLVLYDLKLMDDRLHRRLTGVSNRQVLANARRLAGRNVEIRVPLVPEITDTDENLRAIFAFMNEAGLARASLLPYNASAAAKYEWLGRTLAIDAEPQTPQRLERLVEAGRQAGLDVRIG